MAKLDKSLVQIVDKVSSWQEAVTLSAKPLLDNGYITQAYVDGMIETVNKFGAYIVIAPDIALPHYHGKDDAIKSGFGVMRLTEAVYFDEGNEASKARIIIPLSCYDNEEHINLMSLIATTLSDSANVEKIISAVTPEEIVEVFNS